MGSFLKVLPFFIQMLMEAFKPGEGENVSRANKIMTLIITVLLSYSAFVSYAYVVQFQVITVTHSVLKLFGNTKRITTRQLEHQWHLWLV